jgi:type VI secretion-associated protein, VC_A0119 family
MVANKSLNALTGVEWVDNDPLYHSIGSELTNSPPQGTDLEENDTFDEIVSEMMKRGTLNQSSIRWEWVCDGCKSLLKEKAKDFRLLCYILLCLPHLKKYKDPLTLAAMITFRFFDLWGASAYPSKEKRLTVFRKIVDAMEHIVEISLAQETKQEHIDLISKKLKQSANFIERYDSELAQKMTMLSNRVEVSALLNEDSGLPSLEKILKQPVKTKPVLEVKDKNDSNDLAIELHPENLTLDARHERSLKQSLTSVADFILTFDVENPLSYRLRRFSTWFGIHNAPERKRKDDNKTVIQPVSANALEEYRVAAQRGPMDTGIVQKLERSCNIQPFWIEGQYLAYKLAVICERIYVADAIWDETYRFYSKFDWISQLQFSDATPFVPDEVKEWLEGRKVSNPHQRLAISNEMIDTEMQQIVRQARDKANNGRLDEAISLLENSRSSSNSPRSQTLWEMLMMECLSDWGMKTLVNVQAKRLEQDISNMSVKQFEPELLDRIDNLLLKS